MNECHNKLVCPVLSKWSYNQESRKDKGASLRLRNLSGKHTFARPYADIRPLSNCALVTRPTSQPALQVILHRDLHRDARLIRVLLVLLLNILHVLDADHIAQHVLRRRDEDLAFVERNEGEAEEHDPREAHHDRHDEVPDVEALHVEDVAELTEGEDPADCGYVSATVRSSLRNIHYRSGMSGPNLRSDQTVCQSRNGSKKCKVVMKRKEERRRTSEDLAKVFVQLEPVRQRAEHEEEHSEAEEQQRGKDTGCIPDLAGLVRDELAFLEACECSMNQVEQFSG